MLRRGLLAAVHVGCATVLAGLGGCGISEELYKARLAELNNVKADLDAERKADAEAKKKCKQQLAELGDDNDALKGKLKSLGQNVDDLVKRNKDTSDELDATKKERDELKRQRELAEARAAQFRQLFSKFKSMIDAGKLKVEIRNGLMLVKLADNILFDPGKTDLKPAGKEAIKEVSTILAGINGRKFQVAGHTDNVAPGKHGAFKSNWELSTARAVVVVHFMVDDGGMPPDRLSAAGFADQLPVGSNDTPEGRQQNRRIEIVLLPNIEDLPPMDDVVKDAPTAQATPPKDASSSPTAAAK
jgi:chemotaxis protein MotB